MKKDSTYSCFRADRNLHPRLTTAVLRRPLRKRQSWLFTHRLPSVSLHVISILTQSLTFILIHCSSQTSIDKNSQRSLSVHSRPDQLSSMAISKPTQPKSFAKSLQPSASRSRQTISWSQSMPSVPASSRREVRLLWKNVSQRLFLWNPWCACFTYPGFKSCSMTSRSKKTNKARSAPFSATNPRKRVPAA